MNTKETDKQLLNSEPSEDNTEIMTRDIIKNTPFHVIGTKEGYFGAVGNYRITELEKSKKAISKELTDVNWNRIVQVIMILIEKSKL